MSVADSPSVSWDFSSRGVNHKPDALAKDSAVHDLNLLFRLVLKHE